jgi:hypothetical protein
MRKADAAVWAKHGDEKKSRMPTRRKYIDWAKIKDRELANHLSLCELERQQQSSVLEDSRDFRLRWHKEQEAKPLPPPSSHQPAFSFARAERPDSERPRVGLPPAHSLAPHHKWSALVRSLAGRLERRPTAESLVDRGILVS